MLRNGAVERWYLRPGWKFWGAGDGTGGEEF